MAGLSQKAQGRWLATGGQAVISVHEKDGEKDSEKTVEKRFKRNCLDCLVRELEMSKRVQSKHIIHFKVVLFDR